MGREEGGGFRMGNTCIPGADSCWYMAKPIQYCKVTSFFPVSGFFQWVRSLYQVTKVLELQLQHQSFRWIFRTDFLSDWLVWSPCWPRDSQESSPTPQLRRTSDIYTPWKCQTLGQFAFWFGYGYFQNMFQASFSWNNSETFQSPLKSFFLLELLSIVWTDISILI